MLELSSMSNLIAEKPNRTMSIQQEPLKLKTAYDYLNRLSFTINGTCNKTVELLLGDAVCLVGDSRMINLILTKVGVHALMPKRDRKSTRLNSSHDQISYAVFCLKKKKTIVN